VTPCPFVGSAVRREFAISASVCGNGGPKNVGFGECTSSLIASRHTASSSSSSLSLSLSFVIHQHRAQPRRTTDRREIQSEGPIERTLECWQIRPFTCGRANPVTQNANANATCTDRLKTPQLTLPSLLHSRTHAAINRSHRSPRRLSC
jgi:hypothetical protein